MISNSCPHNLKIRLMNFRLSLPMSTIEISAKFCLLQFKFVQKKCILLCCKMYDFKTIILWEYWACDLSIFESNFCICFFTGLNLWFWLNLTLKDLCHCCFFSVKAWVVLQCLRRYGSWMTNGLHSSFLHSKANPKEKKKHRSSTTIWLSVTLYVV